MAVFSTGEPKNETPKFKPNFALAMITVFGLVVAACNTPQDGDPNRNSTNPVILEFQGRETVLAEQSDIDPKIFHQLKTIFPELARAVCIDEGRKFYENSANFCKVELRDKHNELIDILEVPRVLPEIPADELAYAKAFSSWLGFPKSDDELLRKLVRMSPLEIFEKYKYSGDTVAGRYESGLLQFITYSPQDTLAHTKILLSHEMAHEFVDLHSTAPTLVFSTPEDPTVFVVMGSSLNAVRYHVEVDAEGKISGLTSEDLPTDELFAVWVSQAFAQSQGLGEDSLTYNFYGLGDEDFPEEKTRSETMYAQLNNESLRPIWIKAMLEDPNMLLRMFAIANAGEAYDEPRAVDQGLALLLADAERLKLGLGNSDYLNGEYAPFTTELRDEIWVETQKAFYGDATAAPLLGADFLTAVQTEQFHEFLKRLYNYSTRSGRTGN